MTNWQTSNSEREPTKTKAELRQMLAEAVRNTQPGVEHGEVPAEGQKRSRLDGLLG